MGSVPGRGIFTCCTKCEPSLATQEQQQKELDLACCAAKYDVLPVVSADFSLESVWCTPALLADSSEGRVWVPYTPRKNTVLLVGPGGGTRANAHVYSELQERGWDVVIVHSSKHDIPEGDPPPGMQAGEYLYPPGWDADSPDLTFNAGLNLATLADDIVAPRIRDLVTEGRGPAAVIAGSRGGQVTVPRLWKEFWRGPTVVLNGGCILACKVPAVPVRLVLATFGGDFFPTCNPLVTMERVQKENAKVQVLLCHNEEETHMPSQLNVVLERLLELAIDGPFDCFTDGPNGGLWPLSTSISVI